MSAPPSEISQMRPNAGSDRNCRKAERVADSSNGMAPGSWPASSLIMGKSRVSAPGMASRNSKGGTLFSALLEEFCDQAGPAGLMAGAQTRSGVAVKVFVKKNQVAPMRIALEDFAFAGDGTAAGAVAQKDADQAARNLRRNLPEVEFAVGMRGERDLEVFAVVVVKLLQCFNKEIVHGKPDGAAPIRIASEQAADRLRRFILHTADISVDLHFVGMVLMEAGHGAHTIGRKKFVFVQ